MQTKTCKDCHEIKQLKHFYNHPRTGSPVLRCKECHKAVSNAWRAKNKDSERISHLKRSYKKKSLVISHYSSGKNCCDCCGETHVEFLAVDHINGGGNKERKKLGISGNMFYHWLINNNYPSGYRILCHNCNQAIGSFGCCPHNSVTEFTKVGS